VSCQKEIERLDLIAIFFSGVGRLPERSRTSVVLRAGDQQTFETQKSCEEKRAS